MAEKRNPAYSFNSERALIAYFSDSIPKERIREVIASVKAGFVRRSDSSREDNRIQCLRRCEAELVRIVRDELGMPRG